MAGKSTPAGIRSLVYGRVKGKAGIEGLSVSLKRALSYTMGNAGEPVEAADFLNATLGLSF
jgi:hypothetical protein